MVSIALPNQHAFFPQRDQQSMLVSIPTNQLCYFSTVCVWNQMGRILFVSVLCFISLGLCHVCMVSVVLSSGELTLSPWWMVSTGHI